MLTGEIRSQVDKVWDAFRDGGLANPLMVIEQMTYLLFIRRLDELQTVKEQKANMLKQPIEDPIYKKNQYHLRWSRFKDLDPESMYALFNSKDGAFEFIKTISNNKNSAFNKYMKDAMLMIRTPRLLSLVVDMLSAINMKDRDTKGDLYEYLLSKIATAGDNGQFRTPRHIIKMMVAMIAPKPDDIVCDPAAGTCGFLQIVGEYIREYYPKELLKEKVKDHFNNKMFMGMEFDPTMLRIGAMNMVLHGIENVNLIDVDALSEANTGFKEKCTIVAANPPFKGSLDYDAVDEKLLRVVKTKKTELLFLALILKGLKIGGRAAVIVPDGVMFGNGDAYKQIRKEIIEKQKLEAVISMPSGVFKPYAGVSTAIIIFTKTNSGGTDKVWFYDMVADGLSLDDKRQIQGPQFETFAELDELIKHNTKKKIVGTDIPDIIYRWRNLEKEFQRKRTDTSFLVPLKEIIQNNLDLSINKYKKFVHAEKKHSNPIEIIKEIKSIDIERVNIIKELETMIK